jgi:hypothetical protein
MNIHDILARRSEGLEPKPPVEIQAGGPGSGRHPGFGSGKLFHPKGSFERNIKRAQKAVQNQLGSNKAKAQFKLRHLINAWAHLIPHNIYHRVLKLVDYDPEAALQLVELAHHATVALAEEAPSAAPSLLSLFGESEKQEDQ